MFEAAGRSHSDYVNELQEKEHTSESYRGLKNPAVTYNYMTERK
jgi:hypothetical protein